jgi:hypothetical protein
VTEVDNKYTGHPVGRFGRRGKIVAVPFGISVTGDAVQTVPTIEKRSRRHLID